MADSSKIRTLSDGQLLQGRGEAGLALILSGAVQLSLTSGSGQAAVVAVLGQGSFVGLESVFGKCPGEGKEYRSVGNSALAEIPPALAKRLLQEDPSFRVHCVSLLLSRLAASVSVLADVLHAPLPQRLARRLLGQALAAGSAHGKPMEIVTSQKLIAEMLGASRSTVSEALRRLEKAGIVQRRYRRLRIVDMERLHLIAGEDVTAL